MKTKGLILTLFSFLLLSISAPAYAQINIMERDYIPIKLDSNFTTQIAQKGYMPIKKIQNEIYRLEQIIPEVKNLNINIYSVNLKCYYNDNIQIAGVYTHDYKTMIIFSDYDTGDLKRVVRHELGHAFKFNLVDSKYWGSDKEEESANNFEKRYK